MPPVKAHRPDGEFEGGEQAFKLYGPTCDSLDAMEGPFLLPADIREGDYIEIGMLGAYGVAMSTGLIGCNSGVPEPASVQVPGTGLRLTIVRVATEPFLPRHNLKLMIERIPGCTTDVELFPDTGHTSRRNLYVTRKGLVYVVGQFDARVIDGQACAITLSEFRNLEREVIFVDTGSTDDTVALAREMAPHGINVNCVAPGLTRTALTARLWQNEAMAKASTGTSGPGRGARHSGHSW